MVDMLSRARFDDEDDMVLEDKEVNVDFFESAQVTVREENSPTLNEFNENEYEGEWFWIGRFLRTLTSDAAWKRDEGIRIRMKPYWFFLHNGSIWRHPKKRNGTPLRLMIKRGEQKALLSVYHESPWAGHPRS